MSDADKRYNTKLRSTVIKQYGGRCKYCGESRLSLLQLDHINGDGSATNKKGRCRSAYRDARDNYNPKKYQILCKRCNHAKHDDTEEEFFKWVFQVMIYNGMMHESKRSKEV